jgi:hypothetical protein
MYSSKNVLGVYFVLLLLSKGWRFSVFKGNKCWKPAVWRRFCTIRSAWKAYWTSLTPPTTTPGLGTPPTNSWRTKQFLSRPRGL